MNGDRRSLITANDLLDRVGNQLKTNRDNAVNRGQKWQKSQIRQEKKVLGLDEFDISDISLTDVSEISSENKINKKHTNNENVTQKYSFLDDSDVDAKSEKPHARKFLKSKPTQSRAAQQGKVVGESFGVNQVPRTSAALEKLEKLKSTIESRSHGGEAREGGVVEMSDSSVSSYVGHGDLDVVPVKEEKVCDDLDKIENSMAEEQSGISDDESSYNPVLTNVQTFDDIYAAPEAATTSKEMKTQLKGTLMALGDLKASSKSFVNLGRIGDGDGRGGGDVSLSDLSKTSSVGEEVEEAILTQSISGSESEEGFNIHSVGELNAGQSVTRGTSETPSTNRSHRERSEAESIKTLTELEDDGDSSARHDEGSAGAGSRRSKPHQSSSSSTLRGSTRSLERRRRSVASKSVQTEDPAPHRVTVFTGMGGARGLPPPPLLTPHRATDEQIKAWTRYDPSTLLLHSVMKQQMDLTREFVRSCYHMHQMLSTSNHQKYTTLKDTKDSIRRSRKPIVTYNDALKMAEEEMRSDQALVEYLREERGHIHNRQATSVPRYYERWDVTPASKTEEQGSEQQSSDSVNQLFKEYMTWYRKSPFNAPTPADQTTGQATKAPAKESDSVSSEKYSDSFLSHA